MRTLSLKQIGIALIAAAICFVLSFQQRGVVTELGWGIGHIAPVFFNTVALSAILTWPIAGAALVGAHRQGGRTLFLAAMIIQYVIAFEGVVESGEADSLARLWQDDAWEILSFLALYLAVQSVLWGAFYVRTRRPNGETARWHVTLGEAILAIAVLTLLFAPILIAARWIVISNAHSF